ncbi:hypothetical protein D1B31_06620 [Neobacillus notoginsengisoli]|uniref:Uncharacterized protein n=1 Tax=Neobacillus notoginsengisoli TaxID=1578198 RepID=A0A417YXN1_9BACI|nr:DUF6123 family protein [Neobacillus notoginsengisoli]RHW42289.1 hypothetical protein D1B31_06620 [Neobacillus notoginsengisoli]
MQTVDSYLQHLQAKGFLLQEDAIGFIYFGKHYTNASDEVAIAAIELTLKAQMGFEGSFYVSLLETLVSNNVETKKAAFKFVKENELLSL